jgi:pimeloyl-ACP methyl ester carboxylesterase
MAEKLAELNYSSDGDERTLLIVHGLFGAARNWGALSKRFAQTRRVTAVDMRNHGDSPWTDTHSYFDMAEDLAAVIEAHGAPMDVIGHSMGGKAAMVLALSRPDLVGKLLVGDIAPVAYGHSQQAYIDAMRALDLAPLTRRSEADRAIAVSEPAVRAFLLQSLDFTNKPPRWKLNLNTLEQDMPLILSFPEIAGTFEGPTLFLSGAASDYVTAEGEAAARALFPNANFGMLEGAGHWLHAEKPAAFIAETERFLSA